ncbi:SO_0444 family Cu/Zn efflux transporter [Verrucomicrobiota bacterium]
MEVIAKIKDVFLGVWCVLNEMSPYLLFGFLMAGILSVLVSRDFVERHLGGRGLKEIVKAALMGVPMPLCSCSVIPVTAGLRRHGASKGATTSFLASTPQTGVDSIAVTYSLLGGVFTLFRVVVAFVTGLLCGTMVEAFSKTHDEKGVVDEEHCSCCSAEAKKKSALRRMFEYGFINLPQDIGLALLLGVLISAVLGALVPENYFADTFGSGILTMLVMLLIGTPLYVCSTASIPIAMALMQMGVSPGAALVFLISGPATNAATLSTMWKMIGRRSTLIYLASLFVCALGAGLLFDALPYAAETAEHAHMHDEAGGWFKLLCTVALLLLLLVTNLPKKKAHAHD